MSESNPERQGSTHDAKNQFKIVLALTALLALFATSCSSDSKSEKSMLPMWAQQPTRTVDNGYIVYVGHAEAYTLEKAQFKAEGIALEDLANECSMIPKGSRVEDRYSENTKNGFTAYAKVAIEFQTCDEASKAVDPEQIRKLASSPFTEELRKYQEYSDTGDIPSSAEVASVQPPSEIPPVPTQTVGSNDSTHFYVVRQYVAYQKQIVILSPPGSYAPGSPQTAQFTSTVQPATTQVQTMAAANPTYKTNPTPWSSVPNRPVVARPMALRPASVQQRMNAPSRAMQAPARAMPSGHGGGGKRGRGRRRGNGR